MGFREGRCKRNLFPIDDSQLTRKAAEPQSLCTPIGRQRNAEENQRIVRGQCMPVEISSGDVLDPTIHLERPTDMAAKWIVALMTSMGLVISKKVKSSLPTVEQLCVERPAKPDKMQLLTRGLRAPLDPSREFRVPLRISFINGSTRPTECPKQLTLSKCLIP